MYKSDSRLKISTLKDFKDNILDPNKREKSNQMTNSYIVAVQEVDKHANLNPDEYDANKES